MTKKKKTSNALDIIDGMIGDDEGLRELVEYESLNAYVAHLIYNARKRAGLTQQQLAELAGTHQPVIAQLEDAEYEGHSLSMLQRIAKALHMKLYIDLLPEEEQEAA